MNITAIFIKRPILAIVLSTFILVLGLRSIGLLPIQQYPSLESAVITVNTAFTGADPETISAFITSPLEQSIAQANGIDYMTSSSGQNNSNIQINLLLNWNPDEALTEVNTRVNAVLNQLPKNSQMPTLSITVGQSINSMYLAFYSKLLKSNQIYDYLLRVVQPKIQAVHGVQQANILGNNQFALRAWLDPNKLAGFGITPEEIGNILAQNDFVSATGRTDGYSYVLSLTSNTSLNRVDEFKNMVIKAKDGALVRLKDVAKVDLGSQNYNTEVFYNKQAATYIGIVVAPGANLLNVIDNIKKIFKTVVQNLPAGLQGKIVYDASLFVSSSIKEVNKTLVEAFLIVTAVVFLFLGSLRALIIPVIAIPLSVIGTFLIMLLLSYSINLLTLLALVLSIGLVVDDAIIVVENVFRHIENGVAPLEAALMSAHELTNPIIAITVVVVAVYLPIGFMSGLTGALFTEFAFTLAAAVTVSAVIALTLTPMMCSKILKARKHTSNKKSFSDHIELTLSKLTQGYKRLLARVMKYLPVVCVFAVIILASNYFLFSTSKTELAPQEDQGVILGQLTAAANASLATTADYSRELAKIFHQNSETDGSFEIVGTSGSINPPSLNNSMNGMVMKPWHERKRTTNQLQPLLQRQINDTIAGAKIALFQPPPLPGGGSGLPIQFVIQSSDPFIRINEIAQQVIDQARTTGEFIYLDSDLKYDKAQTRIVLNRDKIAEFGLTMQDVGSTLGASLSQNYINYFNFMNRSYQVIPQMNRQSRLSDADLERYYINTSSGQPVSLATVMTLKHEVVPQNINHFQQLNSATISAVANPFISTGEALATLKNIAEKILPFGYSINYGGQSRQFIQEGASLIVTFFLSLIIIYLSLAVLFNSFRDPLIVLISVPMSICGAMIFISIGVGGSNLNIYTEVGLITLIGLISKHGILIVQFANELQLQGMQKFEAAIEAASIRFRPILMTTGAMVLGVVPLILATGAGAISRFDIGLVIATGISIGTLFTLFVVPSIYALIAEDLRPENIPTTHPTSN